MVFWVYPIKLFLVGGFLGLSNKTFLVGGFLGLSNKTSAGMSGTWVLSNKLQGT